MDKHSSCNLANRVARIFSTTETSSTYFVVWIDNPSGDLVFKDYIKLVDKCV